MSRVQLEHRYSCKAVNRRGEVKKKKKAKAKAKEAEAEGEKVNENDNMIDNMIIAIIVVRRSTP
jgi:hypothetical protein